MPRIRRRSRIRTKKNLRVIKSKKDLRRFGLLLVGLGVVLVAFPLTFKAYVNRPQATKVVATRVILPKSTDSLSNGPIKIDSQLLSLVPRPEPPERIVIPRLGVDLAVVEAPVAGGYWQISETTASHGVGSANPGEGGNVVIFAHAREGLFLPLKNIMPNDSVYVMTNDHWFRYRVAEVTFVDPNATEVIAPTATETLTLFTCSGFLDNKRLIAVGRPW